VIIILVCLGGSLSAGFAILQAYSLIPSSGYIRYWKPLPRLHVEGRYIKNEAGQIVNLTGFNFADLGYPQQAFGDLGSWDGSLARCWRYGPPDINPNMVTAQQVADYMASKWREFGVNSVRVWLNWYTWRNLEEWTRTYYPFPGYIPSIDAIVSASAKNGIYVILSFLEVQSKEFNGVWNTPETFKVEWINFLRELATRYKDEPAVAAIEIINEPKPDQWRSAEAFYSAALEASQAIRNITPDTMIFIETGLQVQPRWTGIDPYLIDNPIHTQVSNVVYVFHRYYWQTYTYRSRASPNYADKGPMLPADLDYPATYQQGNYALAKQQMEQVWYDELLFVLERGYALWYGEFGFNENYLDPNPGWQYSKGEPAWQTALNDKLQLCNKYGVGWSYLYWGPGDANVYGMLLTNAQGYYTSYKEPKARIIRDNIIPLPPSP